MRALILAAGRGNRLGSLTAEKPKCLITIKEKTLLSMMVLNFKKIAINEICVVTGYKNKKIKLNNCRFIHNKHWKRTNMVYSLLCADQWLRNESCIIAYGDIFSSLRNLIQLKKTKANIAITFDRLWKPLWSARFKKPLEDAETFKKNKDNYLIEIGKKPKNYGEVHGQFMGLIKITPKGWKKIKNFTNDLNPELVKKISTTELLQLLVENKFKVRCIPVQGQWGEVDIPSDIKLYKKKFKQLS